ncbi:MAG: flagellar assembly regulator FliX, partial [Brevundimonas sp.]
LMALQGVEDATERRRRAVRRGSGLLDRLDELKLALLSGEAGEGALERLTRTLREDRPEDADPGLKAVLDQIDLRVAVELAKAGIRPDAA